MNWPILASVTAVVLLVFALTWWCFRESPEDKNMGLRMCESREAEIAELMAWRPIGGLFEYLGREMAVTGHSAPTYNYCVYGGYESGRRPSLRADYADNNGVLHNVSFSMAEARAIMAAQPKPKRAKGKRPSA